MPGIPVWTSRTHVALGHSVGLANGACHLHLNQPVQLDGVLHRQLTREGRHKAQHDQGERLRLADATAVRVEALGRWHWFIAKAFEIRRVEHGEVLRALIPVEVHVVPIVSHLLDRANLPIIPKP